MINPLKFIPQLFWLQIDYLLYEYIIYQCFFAKHILNSICQSFYYNMVHNSKITVDFFVAWNTGKGLKCLCNASPGLYKISGHKYMLDKAPHIATHLNG